MVSGNNCIISKSLKCGENVTLGHNVIIEDDVILGNNVYIDSNTIIRSGTIIGNDTLVASNCIIGEYLMDFFKDRKVHKHTLKIGNNSFIRSGSIIYTESSIGNNFQTGHNVTIREKSNIGNNVSIGTLSDIQGDCSIGNYVRLHSNVHIGQHSIIEDYVWIFPYVVLTNDPNPPSEILLGVHIHSFAIIATNSIILPGKEIFEDTLVGAGSIVTKNVNQYDVVVGNPAKRIADIRDIKDKTTGENIYPWKYHFSRAMPWENIGYEEWYKSINLNEENK